VVQPEFVEAMLRAEGVRMEEGEPGDNWVNHWGWREEDSEEDEEVWD